MFLQHRLLSAGDLSLRNVGPCLPALYICKAPSCEICSRLCLVRPTSVPPHTVLILEWFPKHGDSWATASKRKHPLDLQKNRINPIETYVSLSHNIPENLGPCNIRADVPSCSSSTQRSQLEMSNLYDKYGQELYCIFRSLNFDLYSNQTS